MSRKRYNGSGRKSKLPPNPARKVPELVLYMNKVGAEERNFHKWVVEKLADPGEKGRKRYRQRAATILVGDDGTLTVKPEAGMTIDEPSADERAAIIEGFKKHKVEFPKSITHTPNGAEEFRRELGVKDDSWFVLLDGSRTKVLMCQQRIDRDDGERDFIPWSYWSDGHWRPMEPDCDLLPMWKPAEKRHRPPMVHEGAKAAKHVDWLVNDPSRAAKEAREKHPWIERLSRYEHFGWIGGALNPHWTDWGEITGTKPDEIVLVCDRDPPGERAGERIARLLKGQDDLSLVFFDRQFALGFDLADKLPEAMFDGDKWTGPQFEDFIRPATWATEEIPAEAKAGRGRPPKPSYRLRQPFVEQWEWSVKPEFFVHSKRRRYLWTADEFNAKVRPFSDVEDTARLVRQVARKQADGIAYQPGTTSFIIVENQTRLINTWMATSIRPKKGDASPFLKFMEHLFPIKAERDFELSWCATLIARPDIHMQIAVLLIQEVHGVGKTTLMEKILAPLVGLHNCSWPSERTLVESQYTYWRERKRLAIVNEIYQGHNKRAYDKLKEPITDAFIDVSAKYLPSYQIENYLHIIAASNSPKPIQIVKHDRRWRVPEITADKKTPEYWRELNAWLKADGLSIIHQWAIDYVGEHGAFVPGTLLPEAARKRQLIEESKSEGVRLLEDLADHLLDTNNKKWRLLNGGDARPLGKPEKWEPWSPAIITDREAQIWVMTHRGIKKSDYTLESLATVRNILVARGMRDLGERKRRGVRTHYLANCEVGEPGVLDPKSQIDPNAEPVDPLALIPPPPGAS